MTLPESITDNGPIDRNFRALADILLGFENRIAALEEDPDTPTAFTFATGWSNFGVGFASADYYLRDGRVYLRGAIKNGGTGTSLVTTLPTGYRPAATLSFPNVVSGATITVASDGKVTDQTFSASTKAFTSVSNINFLVA